MRDYRDAKSMAQTLRDALSLKNVPIEHRESLEIISKVFGVRDWNTLSAAIQADHAPSQPQRIAPGKFARLGKPTTLPVAPIRDIVVFPGSIVSLYIGREKTISAVKQAMQSDGAIVLLLQKSPTDENPDAAGLYRIGVLASVLHSIETPDGHLVSNVLGRQRVAIDRFMGAGDFCQATAAPVEDEIADKEKTEALVPEVYREYQAYAERRSPTLARLPIKRDIDPAHVAYTVAARLHLPVADQQTLLEATDIAQRLAHILDFLKQNRQVA